MLNEAKERLKTEFMTALDGRLLKKTVLSRPKNKNQGKTTLTPFEKNGELFIKSESFTPDNKALQSILTVRQASDLVFAAPDSYKQINLV